MITRYLESGDWRILLPGIYLLKNVEVTWRSRVMAAILWAGPGAVASGRTAAALHCLRHGTQETIEISVPRKANSAHGITVRCDTSLIDEPRVFVDNIPVTRISRTLLDLCRCLGLSAASEAVVDAVRRRRTTLVDLGRILDEVGGPGKGGTTALRRILTERFAFGVTDSDAEDLFLAMAKRRGYSFSYHYVVRDPGLTAELDFADLPAFLDIELDGSRYHDDPVAAQRDKNRDNELIGRGWVVLRFTYWDLIKKPDWVFEKIESVLSHRRAEQLSMDDYQIGS